jgi:hypothetical protein
MITFETMEQRIKIDVHLSGVGFHPSKIQNSLNHEMTILAESGEIATKGRYRGQLSPYGLAVISLGHEPNNIKQFIAVLLSNKKALQQSGLEKVLVEVEMAPMANFHFEIDAEQTALLKKSNILFSISIREMGKEELTIQDYRNQIHSLHRAILKLKKEMTKRQKAKQTVTQGLMQEFDKLVYASYTTSEGPLLNEPQPEFKKQNAKKKKLPS